MKIYFDSKGEFHKYLVGNRPNEIWLDDFSVEIPYIIIEDYNWEKGTFRGVYNKQTFLSGKLNWMGGLFDNKNLYIKTEL